MTMHAHDKKIADLHLTLPKPLEPVGAYRPVVIHENLAYLSGQISVGEDGHLIKGKLGADLDLEAGMKAARAAALHVVSVIKHHLGFDRFERILRVVGYVQVDSKFTDIHKVMNGASELLFDVFEESGIHARSAVGMASLPLGAAVELEVTVALKPNKEGKS